MYSNPWKGKMSNMNFQIANEIILIFGKLYIFSYCKVFVKIKMYFVFVESRKIRIHIF